ncbi:MAG TPA: NAD(+)/NADH kinase [Terriglobales bacterium]|nr:NAD(+)/NADH kinase [Terriglobales bacterium]
MSKTVAIISKPAKEELKTLAPELLARLTQRGYRVVVDPETAVYLPGHGSVARKDVAAEKPAFVIVLGGDGTLLAAARAVANEDIPILGVNLGSLGFLTEVRLDELYASLDALEANGSLRDPRSMLTCRHFRGEKVMGEYVALNDVVITKSAIARMAEVDVTVDRMFVSSYKADGVIVSTPTGSTAYSLAAGGPVLEPSVDAFVITPVSPHALTNRPLVVKDSAEIILALGGTTEEAYLTVDGQIGVPLVPGDRVVCKKSEHRIQLLRASRRTFFDVLRAKLKWGER